MTKHRKKKLKTHSRSTLKRNGGGGKSVTKKDKRDWKLKEQEGGYRSSAAKGKEAKKAKKSIAENMG